MNATDLAPGDSTQVNENKELISFLCPLCSQMLTVPNHMGGVAGPCPVCGGVIRAPESRRLTQLTRNGFQVTTSQIVLPTLDPVYHSSSRRLQSEAAVRRAPSGLDFSAVKKIEAPLAAVTDESWREKVERDRKQSKRRMQRERFVENVLSSKTARKFQMMGVISLTVILVLTMGVLFINQRSGGALFSKLLGH